VVLKIIIFFFSETI